MFIPFFYLMRERGLAPSIEQWMALLQALDNGLAGSSLMGFYRLCRCLLLTTESDFDRFDEVFLEYFDEPRTVHTPAGDFYDDVMDWLAPAPGVSDEVFFSPEHMEILRRLEEAILRILNSLKGEVLKGGFIGNCEFCTGCGLCMRQAYQSVDVEQPVFEDAAAFTGESAFEAARERNFKDFREDRVLDSRQFGVALRRLRQYSSNSDLPKTEFDIERTIDETADNGGTLRVVYGRPRRNTTKLIVLFDSDGSMWQYAEVSNRLFQAANRDNHFRDLKFYYFHNCIYDHLYTSPACENGEWEATEHVMQNHGSDYKVIYIGDASMADRELFDPGGNVLLERSNRLPGIVWFQRLKRRYPKSVWLNPVMKQDWNRLYGGRTIGEVRRIFPMYELTVQGLNAAVKRLLMAR